MTYPAPETPVPSETVKRRPVPITVIGWLFIVVGAAGLLNDLWPLLTADAAQQLGRLKADGLADLGPAWTLRILAIVGGAALLRGRSWARWLMAGWMAVHLGISLFHSRGEVLVHTAIFVPLCYFLFRPATTAWFHCENAAG